MPNPKISIVTCSFQQGRYLEATMRSVLEQQYSQLEYIVIDGESTDESLDIIKKYADKLEFWVSEKDSGQSEAIDKGFDHSTGEICGWVCSDDLLLPGALQTVGDFFAARPDVDFIYGNALWIDAAGDPVRPKKEMGWNRFVFSFDHNYLAQPSCFWRQRLYRAVGGLDHKFHLTMDGDLWLRFAQQTKPVHLDVYLSCMRMHISQKTQSLKPQARLEGQELRRRAWPSLGKMPTLPLSWLARAARIILKMQSGGYLAHVPKQFLPWLKDLRISSQS